MLDIIINEINPNMKTLFTKISYLIIMFIVGALIGWAGIEWIGLYIVFYVMVILLAAFTFVAIIHALRNLKKDWRNGWRP